MPTRSLTAALALCVATAAAVPVAHAQEADVRWDPGWGRFGWWDVGLTAAYTTEFLLVQMLREPPTHGSRGTMFPDEQFRSAFRAHRAADRATAADVSDAIIYSMLFHALVVDPVVVAWLVHDVEDTAWQLAAIDTQALMLGVMISFTFKALAERERPLNRGCRAQNAYGAGCSDEDRFRSFPSGHTVEASTIAGLTCAHHEHLALYGGGAADWAACGAMIGLAATVGVLRVVSDEHYATDILAGTVMGFVAGWLVPTLLYYGFGDSRRATTSITGVTIEALTSAPTLSWGAAF